MLVVVFLVKRLAAMVAVLVTVSLLVFRLLALSPGSILTTLVGTRPTTPELIPTPAGSLPRSRAGIPTREE